MRLLIPHFETLADDEAERLDGDALDALGVVIVEGEHLVSTYYAAELRGSLKDANEFAQKLELPFSSKAE